MCGQFAERGNKMYTSNVAYAFTKENWDELCEEAREDEDALNKCCSFDKLLGEADVDEDIIVDGKPYHVVCWNMVQWDGGDGDAVDFMNDAGSVLCGQHIRLGEDIDDVEICEKESFPCLLWQDGFDIAVRGASLSAYERETLLCEAVGALVEAAPDAARALKEKMEDRVGKNAELDRIFAKATA